MRLTDPDGRRNALAEYRRLLRYAAPADAQRIEAIERLAGLLDKTPDQVRLDRVAIAEARRLQRAVSKLHAADPELFGS